MIILFFGVDGIRSVTYISLGRLNFMVLLLEHNSGAIELEYIVDSVLIDFCMLSI